MSNRERLLLLDQPSEKLLDAQPIAARVARMVSCPSALAHWRKMVRVAFNQSETRHKVHAEWQTQRDQIFRQSGNTGEPCGDIQPPNNDSVFEFGSLVQVLPENKVELRRVWAWMPRHLSWETQPCKGVPLPLRWSLSLADQYTVLAAIHDTTLKGVDHINPWNAEGEVAPPYYVILLDEAKKILERDRVSLDEILARVEDDQRRWFAKARDSRDTMTYSEEQANHTAQHDAYQADNLFEKATLERRLAEERASKIAEIRNQRQRSQALNEALRQLFHAAFMAAEKVDADLANKETRQELARRIVAVSQELKARERAQALDSLPTFGTPNTGHYLPLRFALRLLRLGRDKTADDVVADLERLNDHPNLRKYYDWFGGLADVFCGPTPHFEGQVSLPAVLPLPVDNCTWETELEVMRALGLLPQNASKSNVTTEELDDSHEIELENTGNSPTVEQLRDAIQDLLFFSVHPDYEDAGASAEFALQTIKAANIAPPGHQKETWLHQFKVDAFELYGHIKTRQLAPDELCKLRAAMKDRQNELWALSPPHAAGHSELHPVGPVFSEADLAKADLALASFLEDIDLDPEKSGFRRDYLVQELRNRQCSLALVNAYLETLTDSRVFVKTQVEERIAGEIIKSDYLETSHGRWYSYLASKRGAPLAKPSPVHPDITVGPTHTSENREDYTQSIPMKPWPLISGRTKTELYQYLKSNGGSYNDLRVSFQNCDIAPDSDVKSASTTNKGRFLDSYIIPLDLTKAVDAQRLVNFIAQVVQFFGSDGQPIPQAQALYSCLIRDGWEHRGNDFVFRTPRPPDAHVSVNVASSVSTNQPRTPVDFVIVTALEEERNAVLALLPDHRKISPSDQDVRVYFYSELPAKLADDSECLYKVVLVTPLHMGRVEAANVTNDAIRRWRPRLVLLVGIAGGIADREVDLGDVLISDQVVDYELQRVSEEGLEVRYNVHRADPSLLGAAKNHLGNDWLNLISVKRPRKGTPQRKIGPIATGDKVVAFKNFLDQYCNDWPKILGVEMEAGGVASACFQANPAPGFFMVRSVSDLADAQKANKTVRKWRSYACATAAAYAIGLLKSGPILPSPPGAPA